MKRFSVIMILVFAVILTGCRAHLESKVSQSRQYADEIGVVLRRVDSLSSTLSERQHIKVEFYPLSSEYSGCPMPTSDTAAQIGPTQRKGRSVEGGGIGAVKSIEIITETEASTHSNALTDSTAVSKTASAETLHKENASEARHDNGTVFIVSVVAAVVLLLALLIIIKKLFNK